MAKDTTEKALMGRVNSVLKGIQKKLGEESIMLLGGSNIIVIERVPTGILALDNALGGGIPRGRIIEMYGPQSSGKTSVALFHLAECQKMYPDRLIAFIDAEHAFDMDLAISYGVDVSRMIFSQPDTGEQALDIVETLAREQIVSCIVVDSVSSLLPEAEDKADMAQNFIGLQARLLSKGMRKLTHIASKTDTTMVFINQIREKVGGYGEQVA